MEAYPHLSTLLSCITDPAQLYPGSILLDHRNRAIDHERRLTTYLAENLPLHPLHNTTTSPTALIAHYTHLTQVLQSETLFHLYTVWRRQWRTPNNRQCGGALVWQLNDSWPTMSWAVVDHYMVPKPAYYAIKRALSPLTIGISRPYWAWTQGHADPTTGLTSQNEFSVWIADSGQNDSAIEGDLELRFISILSGLEISPRKHLPSIKWARNGTTEILTSTIIPNTPTQPLAHSPIDLSNPTTYVTNQAGNFAYPSRHKTRIPPFEAAKHDPILISARLLDSHTTEILTSTTSWPQPLKYIPFASPSYLPRNIRIKILDSNNKNNNGHRVSVSADRPVKGFVFQQTPQMGRVSDNGFDLVGGVEDEVVVSFENGVGDGRALRWTYLGASSSEERLGN
jgi:beta-mannosidase